jgi:hypothetical protein
MPKQGAIDRKHLLAGLVVIGLANGLSVDVVRSLARDGLLGAVSGLFGISVVVFVAMGVALRLVMTSSSDRPSPMDGVLACLFCLAVLVPSSAFAWGAITVLGAVMITTAPARSPLKGAGILLVALAFSKCWSAVLLDAFAHPLTQLDAALATGVLDLAGYDARRDGNVVDNGAGDSLAVMGACSSFTNLSYALLCWLTLCRIVRPAWHGSELAIGGLVVASVVALNVARLSLMAVDSEWLQAVHGDIGGTAFNLITLLATMLIGIYGLRRAA